MQFCVFTKCNGYVMLTVAASKLPLHVALLNMLLKLGKRNMKEVLCIIIIISNLAIAHIKIYYFDGFHLYFGGNACVTTLGGFPLLIILPVNIRTLFTTLFFSSQTGNVATKPSVFKLLSLAVTSVTTHELVVNAAQRSKHRRKHQE